MGGAGDIFFFFSFLDHQFWTQLVPEITLATYNDSNAAIQCNFIFSIDFQRILTKPTKKKLRRAPVNSQKTNRRKIYIYRKFVEKFSKIFRKLDRARRFANEITPKIRGGRRKMGREILRNFLGPRAANEWHGAWVSELAKRLNHAGRTDSERECTVQKSDSVWSGKPWNYVTAHATRDNVLKISKSKTFLGRAKAAKVRRRRMLDVRRSSPRPI